MSRNIIIFFAALLALTFIVKFKLSNSSGIPNNFPGSSGLAPTSSNSGLPSGTKHSAGKIFQGELPLKFSSGAIEDFMESKMVSEKTQAEFKEIARVEVKFPDNFRFQQLNLDFEQITGIFSHTETMDVAILAGRLFPSEKEVKEFLKSEDSGIPNVDGHGITLIGDPVSAQPLPQSGLKSGKYWQGRTADNKGVRVGLVERADGKGSYLFIFTGLESNLNNSDDFFEELYQNLKALPE